MQCPAQGPGSHPRSPLPPGDQPGVAQGLPLLKAARLRGHHDDQVQAGAHPGVPADPPDLLRQGRQRDMTQAIAAGAVTAGQTQRWV